MAGCTFCSITKDLPVPKETIQHIFFPCPTTQKMIFSFCGKFNRNINLNKNIFFLANDSEMEAKNNPLYLVMDLLRYVIWQFNPNLPGL